MESQSGESQAISELIFYRRRGQLCATSDLPVQRLHKTVSATLVAMPAGVTAARVSARVRENRHSRDADRKIAISDFGAVNC
jgi:hypothetical protein